MNLLFEMCKITCFYQVTLSKVKYKNWDGIELKKKGVFVKLHKIYIDGNTYQKSLKLFSL